MNHRTLEEYKKEVFDKLNDGTKLKWLYEMSKQLCEVEELKEKCSFLNEMNEINYKKYCDTLKENNELRQQRNYATCLACELQEAIDELEEKTNQLINDKQKLKEQLKDVNKGLSKVINRSTKYKRKYYKSKHIIDKLERHLEIEINDWQDVEDMLTRGMVQEDRNILNMIQKLKGSDINV